MPMHERHRHGPHWWPDDAPWPPQGGPGREAWSKFGKKMFLGVLLFFIVVTVLIAVLGFIVATFFGIISALGRLFLFGLGTLIVISLMRRVLGRTWRPVQGLVDAAGRLADGDYEARVDVAGAGGAKPVARSFNTLAERLEHADEQRRNLMSDLSHEFRTPLSVIRGEIEAVIDGVRDGGPEHMESLLDEVEIMERLIEDLRVLALSEAGKLPLQTEPTDVVALARELVDSYSNNARGNGATITLDAPNHIPQLDVDAIRVRQALSNLVVNSLRAMPHGGSVRVVVVAEPEGVVFDVIDTGIGIAPDELETVFERFTKASDSPGSGLGLSIARGLARAHGGDLSVVESSPSGTTLRLGIPR